MIICPHCGATVTDGASFCPLCFTTLGPAPQTRRTFHPAVQQLPEVSQQPLQPQAQRRFGPTSFDAAEPPRGFDRAYHARTDLNRTDPALAREQAAHPSPAPMPRWLTFTAASLLLAALLCLALVMLMRADLANRQDSKRRAYQTILNEHPLASDYQPMILRYAEQYNLQPAFVSSIILHESSFRPTAESRIGARGLMQVMEDTGSWIAQRLGVAGYSFDMLWDPETNIRFGCWYLNYLSKLFDGDPVLVAAAYHAGQGNVSVWLRNPGYSEDGIHLDIERIPTDDTRWYVREVIRDYAIYDALYYHAYNSGDTAIRDPDLAGGGPG